MKKFFITLTVICICLAVYAKSQDDKFINALRNCSKYESSGDVNTQGVNAQSHTEILGWHNEKCGYKETINLNGVNVNISCHFSKSQVKEITSVADAYYTTLQYSNESPDTSSLDAIQNNPLANVFNKYIQDPNVCTIGGLQ